jgi:hypothetical protein
MISFLVNWLFFIFIFYSGKDNFKAFEIWGGGSILTFFSSKIMGFTSNECKLF